MKCVFFLIGWVSLFYILRLLNKTVAAFQRDRRQIVLPQSHTKVVNTYLTPPPHPHTPTPINGLSKFRLIHAKLCQQTLHGTLEFIGNQGSILFKDNKKKNRQRKIEYPPFQVRNKTKHGNKKVRRCHCLFKQRTKDFQEMFKLLPFRPQLSFKVISSPHTVTRHLSNCFTPVQ